MFRDFSNGAVTTTYGYDTRAGLTAAQTRDVFYGYDLLGRQLTAKYDSATGADGITNVYNGFGELTSATAALGTFAKALTYQYDTVGRRTRVTYPDAQAFTYAYDARDRLTSVYEGTGTTTSLDAFAYNADGTLASRTEGTGASSAAYTWDAIGRLTSQADTIGGTGNNVSWTFSLNPASQITSEGRTETSNAYAYTGLVAVNRNYGVNGLNQYTTAGTASFTYDANGNLTADGTNTYVYDIENRLVKAVAGSVTTNLLYDPLGRLFQTDKGTAATTTKFLYDGDALVSEFNSSNGMTARYVHGSNAAADDPLVWYTGTGSTTKRWLHADHLGSVVAVTTNTGASFAKNAYDEYGIPQSPASAAAGTTGQGNVYGRFGYTGQAWLPEVGLYYYKARVYSPTFGRFMQTDPIGYADGANWYAYVANDPVNMVDPLGLDEWDNCIGEMNCGGGVDDLYAKGKAPPPPPPCPGGTICINGQRLPIISPDAYNGAQITGPAGPTVVTPPSSKKKPQAPKPPADKRRSQCAAGVVGGVTFMILEGGTHGLVAGATIGEIAAGGLALAAGPTLIVGGVILGVVAVVAVGTYYSDQKNGNSSADSLANNFGVCS